MSAPAGPLRPTDAQERVLAELKARVDELEREALLLDRANSDLRDQLAGARTTVAEQQAEYSAARPRHIRTPRPAVRDLPTGEAL